MESLGACTLCLPLGLSLIARQAAGSHLKKKLFCKLKGTDDDVGRPSTYRVDRYLLGWPQCTLVGLQLRLAHMWHVTRTRLSNMWHHTPTNLKMKSETALEIYSRTGSTRPVLQVVSQSPDIFHIWQRDCPPIEPGRNPDSGRRHEIYKGFPEASLSQDIWSYDVQF